MKSRQRSKWNRQAALALIVAPLAVAAAGRHVLAVEQEVSASPAMAGAGQSASKTVWEGVYTEAQAQRGRQIYLRACSLCHSTDLSGGDDGAPALVGRAFTTNWQDLPVHSLFVKISDLMPKDSPSSLSPQAYIDIVTFLLEANEFPAGETELPPDPETLKTIVFVEQQR